TWIRSNARMRMQDGSRALCESAQDVVQRRLDNTHLSAGASPVRSLEEGDGGRVAHPEARAALPRCPAVHRGRALGPHFLLQGAAEIFGSIYKTRDVVTHVDDGWRPGLQ